MILKEMIDKHFSEAAAAAAMMSSSSPVSPANDRLPVNIATHLPVCII